MSKYNYGDEAQAYKALEILDPQTLLLDLEFWLCETFTKTELNTAIGVIGATGLVTLSVFGENAGLNDFVLVLDKTIQRIDNISASEPDEDSTSFRVIDPVYDLIHRLQDGNVLKDAADTGKYLQTVVSIYEEHPANKERGGITVTSSSKQS